MVERISGVEASLLARDEVPHPWHLTEVLTLAGDGLGVEEVGARVAERIAWVPRFRQRPSRRIGEAWVDDASFGVAEHVRALDLPAGAGDAQMLRAVAELLHLPLARFGPRWELGVVGSLRNHRSALVARVQPAWVDAGNVHLLQELLDDGPVTAAAVAAEWAPTPAPAAAEPMQFVTEVVRDPGALLKTAGSVLGRLGALLGTAAPAVPRYVAGTAVPLATVRRVAAAAGVSVHDVLVSLVAGGLRRVGDRRDPVALVPFATRERDAPSALGFGVAPAALALPVRIETPADRLAAVASLTLAHRETGTLVPAAELVDLPGWAPATMHALSARAAIGVPHEVVVANAPGPQSPRWLGERQVRASYPFWSLTDAERVAVAMTSYCGQVYIGLTGIEPVDELATGIVDELADLARLQED